MLWCLGRRRKKKSRSGTGNIPKAAFIYSFKSKTFILAVWHFITTHHDWHSLTHMMLSGYTRTIAKELQKINPWFLITIKKKSYTYQKLLMHCIEKKVCAHPNLKRHSRGCWKLTRKFVKLMVKEQVVAVSVSISWREGWEGQIHFCMHKMYCLTKHYQLVLNSSHSLCWLILLSTLNYHHLDLL